MTKQIAKIMQCSECHYKFFTLADIKECSKCFGKLELIAQGTLK